MQQFREALILAGEDRDEDIMALENEEQGKLPEGDD